MVDEYVYVIKLRGEAEKRSDSSMVDEYEYPARPSTGRTGSDSSMVDEYYLASLKVISASKVQIPLWSMNTRETKMPAILVEWFRFLYGR